MQNEPVNGKNVELLLQKEALLCSGVSLSCGVLGVCACRCSAPAKTPDIRALRHVVEALYSYEHEHQQNRATLSTGPEYFNHLCLWGRVLQVWRLGVLFVMQRCGSACAGGFFANVLLAVLSRSPSSLPSSSSVPRSQVWHEGSPSILTGVSKEVSVSVLFSIPSPPEQRLNIRYTACLFFVFRYPPLTTTPPSSFHLLHHFVAGSRDVFLEVLTCPVQQAVLITQTKRRPAPLSYCCYAGIPLMYSTTHGMKFKVQAGFRVFILSIFLTMCSHVLIMNLTIMIQQGLPVLSQCNAMCQRCRFCTELFLCKCTITDYTRVK